MQPVMNKIARAARNFNMLVPRSVVLQLAHSVQRVGRSVSLQDGVLFLLPRRGWRRWQLQVDNIIAVRGVPHAQRRPGEVRLIVENPANRVGAEFEKRTAVIDLAGGLEALTWTESRPTG